MECYSRIIVVLLAIRKHMLP